MYIYYIYIIVYMCMYLVCICVYVSDIHHGVRIIIAYVYTCVYTVYLSYAQCFEYTYH